MHSQYSLLQGAIHVEDLVARASEFKMPAVAITDTNNLFGAIDFYLKAKEKGIKPIIGCELWYHPEGYTGAQAAAAAMQINAQSQSQFKPKFFQLVILCKNLVGYQNLCKMVTESYKLSPPPQKGQLAIPKFLVSREQLIRFGASEENKKNWVVLSGGLRGEIPYHLLMGEEDEAKKAIHFFKEKFEDDFYFELQDNGIPEQEQVNAALTDLGEKLGVEVVATCDAHYLNAEDAEAHEVLQCIESGRNLDLDRPKSLVPSEFYFKSSETMSSRFDRTPKAIENSLIIAEKCNVEFKFKDAAGKPIYHLPNFRPDGVERGDVFDALAFFRDQSREGLQKRFASPQFEKKRSSPDWESKKKEYEDRLELEIAMILRTGFSGYFLIVSDFIKWAKNNGIPVGPGRGSGAGSLVAYCLFITDIDPLQFNLLFERFINPERISMPDFDIDFCQDRRSEVIEYVERKYGKENVCQIITYGKLQARAVLRDVGRVLGLAFSETDEISKLLPDELGITLSQAIEKEPRLREKMEREPKVNTVLKYSLLLEGLYRNAGIHAAGVIITEEPVVNYCALFVGKDGDVVTQFDKDAAEKIGLIKYDFLGLKTLTVIDNAVRFIKERHEFDLEKINFEDEKVFALISSGDTDGVFQVESSGMKDLCMRIVPSNLEDITAINALYRPGPLGSGMVDDFIERKHGRREIVYDDEKLATILKETYGVILYQEQVMHTARDLAGYSLGQADLLRRAMGKKKPEEMQKQREIFVKGATERGTDPKKAESIFDLMAKFAEYGFNKSHSAAYGMITYQTAYLKTYYPHEFMAALMATEINDTDKITKYIADAKNHGIPILPPDVNFSQKSFSVDLMEDGQKAIRFGLEAIKGVGGIAVDVILEARQSGKPFSSVLDFCKRVSTRKVNKKVLESLTISGALDSISEVNRPSILASIETLLEHASDEQAERELGQTSLFDQFSAEDIKLLTPVDSIFKKETDWPRSRKLMMEKQITGFYVSGHPMDTWQKICEDWLGFSIERLKEWALSVAEKLAAEKKKQTEIQGATGYNGGGSGGGYSYGQNKPKRPEVRIAGLIAETKEVMTKKGARMGFGKLEDLTGSLELVFFPEAYAQCQEILKRSGTEAEPVIITGEIEGGGQTEATKILVKTISWLEEVHKDRVQQVLFKIPLDKVSPDQLRELKKRMIHFKGKTPVRIEFFAPEFKTKVDLPITVGLQTTPQMVQAIDQIFGFKVVQMS